MAVVADGAMVVEVGLVDPSLVDVAPLMAGIAAAREAHTEAAVLLGRATGLLEATGGELVLADGEIYQRVWSAALADLGEDRLTELLASGARGASVTGFAGHD